LFHQQKIYLTEIQKTYPFETCATLSTFLQRRMSGCCRRSCGSDTQMRFYFAAPQASILMPLSSSSSRRALKHTRAIHIEAYARDDGLWDIDAHITDVKTRDTQLASGTRPFGSPIHDLWLRLTIDTQLTVVAVEAVSDAVPYPAYCDTIGPAYEKLVGLNLRHGFRNAVKERMSGIQGCTHLTELAQVLPTAAIQAFAGEVLDTRDGADTDRQSRKPFQLDRCHALRTDGAAVAQYYPRWAVKVPDPTSST
jgi:hypothetical protein